MGIITRIQGIWQGLTATDLDLALDAMVQGAGDQVTALLPIGIGLMFVLAIPRIVRRVLNTFM